MIITIYLIQYKQGSRIGGRGLTPLVEKFLKTITRPEYTLPRVLEKYTPPAIFLGQTSKINDPSLIKSILFIETLALRSFSSVSPLPKLTG